MPNWTGNDLIVTGDPKELARFKTQAIADEKDFSFEPFLPMPEELKSMHHGAITIKGVQYSNWYIVNGVDIGLDKKESGALIKKYGADNWYDRNCNVLGTKWDVDGEIYISEPKKLGYTFQSAWAPPVEGIQAISNQFPKLTFALRYDQEEGGGGFVRIKNGEILRETTRKR